MTNPAFVVLILLVTGIFLPANAVRGQTGATVAYPISTGGNPLRRHIPSQGGNLAISGYDPVAYFIEGRAVEGSDQFEFLYANARWHFSSSENLDAFADDPESYIPRYGGFCTVCMIEHGGLFDSNPKIWTIVKGNLYLNYDVRTRQKFRQNSGSYIQLADEIWASLTPAPEAKAPIKDSGAYRIAIVPLGSHLPSDGFQQDLELEVTERLKSYIRGNRSLEVTYSYDAVPSDGPDISPSQVWTRGLRPQDPDLEFSRKLGEQLGVQGVVTAWYRNPPSGVWLDRAKVELYVTDVSRGTIYREKGFVSEIDEMAQRAFSAFIAGRKPD